MRAIARRWVAVVLVFLLLMLTMIPIATAQSRIFRVQEGDLVRLRAQAHDLDKDHVVFRYSPPLDANGEWQTDFDDAGEYGLTLTASDGVNEQVQQIKLIVENTNQPPRLTDSTLVVKETQTIDLKPLIEDADGDALHFTFEPPFDQQGVWETGYGDAGGYVALVKVSDGSFTQEFRIGLTVLNTPRELRFTTTFSESQVVHAREGEVTEYWVDVEAENADEVSYRWELDGLLLGTAPSGSQYWSFDIAGEHTLKVSAADELQEASREWIVRVEEVNRPPALVLLPMTVREGEKLVLSLPEKDEDGDRLQYSFEAPLENDGTWQTDFDDAGLYQQQVSVSDGEETFTDTLSITVVDADRAPVLTTPDLIRGKESEEISVHIQGSDADGDLVQYSISSPLSYSLETNGEGGATLYFQPDYDAVKRGPGAIHKVLQFLGLDRLLLRSKTFPVRVEACGKEQCATAEMKLLVHNVNRPPEFTSLNAPMVKETETVHLEAEAIDPDGDTVRYLFGPPAHRTSGTWETTYGDKGTHTLELIATDGKEKVNTSVVVTILKNNRPPVLEASSIESTVREGEKVVVHFTTSDPDNDNVTIWVEDLPEGASFQGGVLSWTPEFGVASADRAVPSNAGIFRPFTPGAEEVIWLRAVASDGEAESILPVKIIVQHVNQKPRLLDFTPTEETVVQTNAPVLFHVAVKDDDNDPLSYNWEFGFLQGKVKGTDTVRRTFLTPGEKTIKVTASDGAEVVKKEWRVRVEESLIPELPPEIGEKFEAESNSR